MAKENINNVVSCSTVRQTLDKTPRLRLVFSKDSIKLSTLIEQHVLAQTGTKEKYHDAHSESTVSESQNEVSQALRDFENNKYVVIVNEQQIRELDEDIPLRAEMNAVFIELPSIISG